MSLQSVVAESGSRTILLVLQVSQRTRQIQIAVHAVLPRPCKQHLNFNIDKSQIAPSPMPTAFHPAAGRLPVKRKCGWRCVAASMPPNGMALRFKPSWRPGSAASRRHRSACGPVDYRNPGPRAPETVTKEALRDLSFCTSPRSLRPVCCFVLWPILAERDRHSTAAKHRAAGQVKDISD